MVVRKKKARQLTRIDRIFCIGMDFANTVARIQFVRVGSDSRTDKNKRRMGHR